jgi:hypothetical protein
MTISAVEAPIARVAGAEPVRDAPTSGILFRLAGLAALGALAPNIILPALSSA